MSEELFIPVEHGKILSIDVSKMSTRLIIPADEIIIQCGKLQIKIPSFWPLEDINEIVFEIKDKTYKFKQVKKK